MNVALRPWEVATDLPPKPDSGPYGFVRDGEISVCPPENLAAAFRQEPFHYLWTPASPFFARPEGAPELLEVYRGFARKAARGSTMWGLILTLGSVALFAVFQDWQFLYRNLFFVLGVLFLAMGLWQYRAARNFTQADAIQMADEARFGFWLDSVQLPKYSFTYLLAGIFGVVLVAQYVWGGSGRLGLAAAALDKDAVRQGEWWRLLTCAVMHGSFFHCWMNTMALLDFGRRVEVLAHRAYVPLVFLWSALCGSLMSLWLYPHTTSVGASGGLMGLLGFLLAASWRRPDAFPRWFLRSSLRSVMLIGVLGVAGFAFIDNAAHFGGLAGGAALGGLLVDRETNDFPLTPKIHWQVLGTVALLVVVLVAAWAGWKIH